jgi:hypothetical protein
MKTPVLLLTAEIIVADYETLYVDIYTYAQVRIFGGGTWVVVSGCPQKEKENSQVLPRHLLL